MFRNGLFRNFYEFIRAGAADGACEISGKLFTFKGENTIVASVLFHCDSPLRMAVAAKTGKGQLATLNLATGALFSIAAQFGGNGDLMQIQHCIAIVADEVYMRFGVGIEPLGAIDVAHADDLALLFEKGQISIDRCLGDIRVGFLQHLVYHLGGGVGVGVHQTVQNCVALSELFVAGFHRHLLWFFLRVILIYKWIITYPFRFVNKNYSHLQKYFFRLHPNRTEPERLRLT